MWSLEWIWLACTGSERRDYLERMLTCSVANLEPGETAHGLLLSRTGRSLGELWLLADEYRTLVAIASGGEVVVNALEKYILAADVKLERFDWVTGARLATVAGSGWAANGDGVRFRALLGRLSQPPLNSRRMMNRIWHGWRSWLQVFPTGTLSQ